MPRKGQDQGTDLAGCAKRQLCAPAGKKDQKGHDLKRGQLHQGGAKGMDWQAGMARDKRHPETERIQLAA